MPRPRKLKPHVLELIRQYYQQHGKLPLGVKLSREELRKLLKPFMERRRNISDFELREKG